MNTELIVEAVQETLAGTAPLPEIVAKLITAGVEYYHVDFAVMRKTFYGSVGDTIVSLIKLEGMPPIGAVTDR